MLKPKYTTEEVVKLYATGSYDALRAALANLLQENAYLRGRLDTIEEYEGLAAEKDRFEFKKSDTPENVVIAEADLLEHLKRQQRIYAPTIIPESALAVPPQEHPVSASQTVDLPVALEATLQALDAEDVF